MKLNQFLLKKYISVMENRHENNLFVSEKKKPQFAAKKICKNNIHFEIGLTIFF